MFVVLEKEKAEMEREVTSLVWEFFFFFFLALLFLEKVLKNLRSVVG